MALPAPAWHSHPSLSAPPSSSSSSPTTHPPNRCSLLIFHHPCLPSSSSPSPAIAPIPESICHPIALRATADAMRKEGERERERENLGGNMQKCKKVDAGCPGNCSEVISKR
ncbi:unnamed protein product [Pleuronectes platessa]|uniref:Uncharacterized protein n=1 Tax=Pleuronectes platessa TaxID=8262 RepID=A0A9N7ZBW1_PLEPL|nr:unnamed protein product [Pleuronectes platessa]